MKRKNILSQLILIILFSISAMNAETIDTGQAKISLVSEVRSIQAGQPFWVSMRMSLAPHWHVYWINPGDAGAAPAIDWELPDDFKAGDIQWPYPERVPLDEFVNFGYEDDVDFLVEITPAESLPAGAEITLKASVNYLICKDICIPESGELSLTLPVSDGQAAVNPAELTNFSNARTKLPIKSADWQIAASISDTTLYVSAIPPAWFSDEISQIEFYPVEEYLIHNSAPQPLQKVGSGYQLAVPLSPDRDADPTEISGMLVSDIGWRGAGSERALEIKAAVGKGVLPIVNTAGADGVNSFGLALMFAFVGGMILNLMPCVLPVLSLKILGFVQQAGEDKSKVFQHGLSFTGGVLVSFWVLAGALLLLRAGGEQLGWGFQLQSPVFVTILSIFLFLFGLSLFGVFEIGTSLMNVGQGNAMQQSGNFGSFMSGVTATVVATPCTAPFMGGALGYAISQPPLNSMLIFTFLGLGMAAPYVVLASVPGLLKFVPKPGPWMDSLKQFMGFLLMATVIWLIWVFGSQAGTNAVSALLLVLMFSGMGAWILGRWGNIMKEKKTRLTAQVIAILTIALPLYFFLTNLDFLAVTPDQGNTVAVQEEGAIQWQNFSPQLVSKLRDEGKPVFIDFTAKWCLSCQVNKKVAFSSSEVQAAFADKGINAVIADWTNYDATIAKALAEFGRNSVPLYVLYSPDPAKQPIVLPELLTPGIVLDALKQL